MKRKAEPWRVRCCANCKHWKDHGMHGFRVPRHRFKDR